MVKITSKKICFKASAYKPLGNTPIGYKTSGLDPEIRFYELEDDYKTEEG